jgi:transposase InsO family protein
MIGALKQIAAWRKEYNKERPHSSLGYKPRASLLLLRRPQTSTERSEGQWLALPLPILA